MGLGWLPPLRPLLFKKTPPPHPPPTLGGRPCPARLASSKRVCGVVRAYVVPTPSYRARKYFGPLSRPRGSKCLSPLISVPPPVRSFHSKYLAPSPHLLIRGTSRGDFFP